MRDVLDPLRGYAGVQRAMVFTADGLALTSTGFESEAQGESAAALLSSWLHEVSRTLDPLAWDEAESLRLEGSQGTVHLLRAAGAWIATWSQGTNTDPEVELRLGATASRLCRQLRALAGETASEVPSSEVLREPRAALPQPNSKQLSQAELTQQTKSQES